MRCALFILITACHAHRASPEDCAKILDRLVDIELHERGYRDPKLLEARTTEMRKKFSDRLRACAGRPINPDASRCIDSARTTEELIHACLRL